MSPMVQASDRENRVSVCTCGCGSCHRYRHTGWGLMTDDRLGSGAGGQLKD